MQTIKPFIEAGWYTLPLAGHLERNEDGSKTVPRFQKGWLDTYSNEFNTFDTTIGGVLTGHLSGIVAIDCDNTATDALFRALANPDDAYMESVGKGKQCGTFIYQYDASLGNSFAVKDGSFELDFMSDGKMIYLPTESNKTKKPWTEIPTITKMPEAMVQLLQKMRKPVAVEAKQEAQEESLTPSYLAPLVEDFCKRGEYDPQLFKIITPRDYRDHPDYIKHGHVHPNEIPSGAGSDYLVRISAIFGADPSISAELYIEAMHAVNKLWDAPMSESRLDKTICDPMVQGSTKIDGKVVWNYDQDWERARILFRTSRKKLMEAFYDPDRQLRYIYDTQSGNLARFDTPRGFTDHINALSVVDIPAKRLKTNLPQVDVVHDPLKPHGFSSNKYGDRTFNQFKPTPELRILLNPNIYKDMYKEPRTILRFLESLVPDPIMRDYLLKFMRKKLTTFSYSPVILYFLGAHGSGKDTIVNIMEQIIGDVTRPTAEQFLEKNNSWALDTYVVQLDEIGDQLTYRNRELAMGILKTVSGKPKHRIRLMRTDGYELEHAITFIITANKNPLAMQDGDRRMAFFVSPNSLAKQEWVEASGGLTEVHRRIKDEVKDFCFYLATKVEDMPVIDYMTAPESKDKLRIMADSMNAAERLAFVLKNEMFTYLEDLALTHNTPEVIEELNDRKLTSMSMSNLYDQMTNYQGEINGLHQVFRKNGIAVRNTTVKGVRCYLYQIPFKGMKKVDPFTADDEGDFDA